MRRIVVFCVSCDIMIACQWESSSTGRRRSAASAGTCRCGACRPLPCARRIASARSLLATTRAAATAPSAAAAGAAITASSAMTTAPPESSTAAEGADAAPGSPTAAEGAAPAPGIIDGSGRSGDCEALARFPPPPVRLLRLDRLALELRVAHDRLALPLARVAAAFLEARAWRPCGAARLEDHARERLWPHGALGPAVGGSRRRPCALPGAGARAHRGRRRCAARGRSRAARGAGGARRCSRWRGWRRR